MSDEAERRVRIPEPARRPTLKDRTAALVAAWTGGKRARGVLLAAALTAFTLLYALLLHWLSTPDNSETAVSSVEVPATSRAVQTPVPRSNGPYRQIDDEAIGGANGLAYSGSWQHIHNFHDGRSAGTSSRTYHIGATASFRFTGRKLRIYGVMGRNGGYAELLIDGETYALLRFYAPHKRTNAVLYTSPVLPAGAHLVEIVVAEAPSELPKRRYVNLDGIAYQP